MAYALFIELVRMRDGGEGDVREKGGDTGFYIV
jgi:hypothetical protein